jgi:hypothetical protein
MSDADKENVQPFTKARQFLTHREALLMPKNSDNPEEVAKRSKETSEH